MKGWAIGLVILVGCSCGLVCQSADFDGDGTNDIGVFRPSVGLWAIRGVTRSYFGGSVDNTVPGDYNGDGTSEIGIFRAASGLWAIQGVTRVYFGGSADEPVGKGPKGDTGLQGPVGPVAGSDGQVVYNNNGSAAGAEVYYDNSTGHVGIGTTAHKDYNLIVDSPGQCRVWLDGISSYLRLGGDSGSWELRSGYSTGDFELESSNCACTILRGNNTTDNIEIRWSLMMDDVGDRVPAAEIDKAGIYAYGSDVGTPTELYAIDESGNTTLLSPHDKETGEWIFYSKNIKTGRIVRVDMERMVSRIEELTGEKFMVEMWENPVPE